MKGITQFDATGVIVEGTDAEFIAAINAGALAGYTELTTDGKLTSIPAEIARLGELKSITLGGKLATVDPAIFSLAHLERLSIQTSKLVALPTGGWGRLGALTTLELTMATLRELPEDLGEAPKLGGSFDLRMFKHLKALPESFGRLSHVTELHVPWGLKALPPTFSGMTGLVRLGVHKTAIGALPDSIGGFTALTELYANDAKLKRVPESIGACVALREVNLGDNKLATVPAALFALPAIEVLSVENNPIGTVPTEWSPSLTVVRLRGTQVKAIPAAVATLPNLRLLTLPAEFQAAIEASSGAVLAALGARAVFA